MLTLWDILPKLMRPAAQPRPAAVNRISKPRPSVSRSHERYDELARDLLEEYGVRVRKWRSSMSGVAWQVTYQDGTVSRLIEAPKPRGPMSAAVFCHEIGHHAIGFHRYKPRCLEEFHAWDWALKEMERRGVNVTDRVRERMHESLHYAIQKAARRGLKQLPVELAPFMSPPPRKSDLSASA
ncbi:MAG: hypothetical protein R3B46_04095 [Phycisphaerales bacterium]|nr:hypothetical protein [Phycisphaerales bacterium]